MAELVTDIDAAREAIARGSWAEAYERLSSLDPSQLSGRDLEGLADAAWWVSRLEESIAARQRAYAAYAAEPDDRAAAVAATRLCIEHFQRREPAVAGGWLMRAQRHLREQPECPERAFLLVAEATIARFTGDAERSAELARRATELGQRLGHRDMNAMAIHTEGLALIALGRVVEGVSLLDEAMTSVLAGELSAFFTGLVYCNVIEACLQIGDVGRAGEWSEAARSWCETVPPESPFPGFCRVNRAELAIMRGEWSQASAEASRASDELGRINPEVSAAAWYLSGEVRRRSGDVAGADEAFARAQELGFDPQPGVALLRLAQGKVEAARTALRVAVAGDPGGPLRRARLLAAQVDAAVAAGDFEEAAAVADELEAFARRFGAAALIAMAHTARGTFAFAMGDADAALEHLRRACTGWRELRLPHEEARARMSYAQAVRAAGDEDGALAELRAALAVFERLGAVADAALVIELLGGPTFLPRGLTAREAEVLRLLAAGRSNRVIAAELVISEHTVARHLQNIFAKLDVSSRSAATAFAFEHGLA